MGIFGWSYPPGVSRLPWDDLNLTCEICLGNPDDNSCLCPECEICGAQGDPACYGKGHRTNHGLQVSKKHLPVIGERRRVFEEDQRQQKLADAATAEFNRMCLEYPYVPA